MKKKKKNLQDILREIYYDHGPDMEAYKPYTVKYVLRGILYHLRILENG